MEPEWFAGYVNIGSGIQTYNFLLQSLMLFPQHHTASQKERKKGSEFTEATMLKSKNREV